MSIDTPEETRLDEPALRATPRAAAPHGGDAVFVVGFLGLLAEALVAGRHVWFYSDDWNVLTTYHAGNWMTPFNGHWSLVPVAIFRALLTLFGLRTYVPYQLVGIVWYAALSLLLYLHARRRLPGLAAALVALSVMLFSSAQLVVMFPFLMNFTIPLTGLLAAWWLVDRDRLASDVAAAGCLMVGVMSSGVGLLALAAVVTELVLKGRRAWHRLLPFAAVGAVWVVWYESYYEPAGPTAPKGIAVRWGWRLVQAYGRAAVGGWSAGRWLWLAGLLALAVAGLVARRWTPRAAGIALALGTFVVLTSFRDSHLSITVPPDLPWYLWLLAFFVAALVTELARDRKIPVAVVAVGAVIVAAGAFQLHRSLADAHRGEVAAVASNRTWLAAADALGDRAAPDSVLVVNILPVRDADYLSLARHYGSPVKGIGLSQLGTLATRQEVDTWMLTQLRVHPEPVPAGFGGRCQVVGARAASEGVPVPLGGTLVVQVGAQRAKVQFRRFAPAFPARSFLTLASGDTSAIRLPSDLRADPWYVKVDGGREVRLCR